MSTGPVSPGPGQGGVGAERGAGTVFVLALTGVVLTVAMAVAACAGLLVAHRQSQAAADLAALAGAVAVRRGADACAAARQVATLNEARLVSCLVDGRQVRVRAGVRGPAWAGFGREMLGEAVAGPGEGVAGPG